MGSEKESQNEIILTTKQFSELLDLSPRRIQQLAEEGVLVKVSRGQYKLIESIRNYIAQLQSRASEQEVDYYREKALHEKAKREKAELTLMVMKGELHRSEDVRFVMNDMIAAFRSKMLNIPAKIAPQLVGKKKHSDIQHMLAREVRDALAELSEYDPEAFYAKSSDYVDVNDDEDSEE
ncbi:hypothetical protein [Brevibacillus fulvus]|uniref:Phage terminase Nu1 subunit (DNA packaging protein) n=1 Tax=Brevibacillus fulvus TaxID=1125967 RepID=A0A938XXZ3_9BACL|nr:hypothetical protein [Brevibacillus fulvus]MBM7592267.1 phage terminase Nu1 subunit (DNA packaging protein) [Brevibacillus fulvus]